MSCLTGELEEYRRLEAGWDVWRKMEAQGDGERGGAISCLRLKLSKSGKIQWSRSVAF